MFINFLVSLYMYLTLISSGNPVRASGPIRALKSGSIAQSAINKARFSTGPGPTGKVSVCTDILTKMLEDHQSSWLRNLKEYNLIYTTSLNVMEYSWSSAATEAIDLNLIKTQLWHKGVSLCPIQSEKLDGKYLEVLRCHLETLGIPGNAKLHGMFDCFRYLKFSTDIRYI